MNPNTMNELNDAYQEIARLKAELATSRKAREIEVADLYQKIAALEAQLNHG